METQLPPKKKGDRAPILGPFLLRPNGWMNQHAILGKEVGLSPGDIVLDGDPARPLPKTGAQQPYFSVHVYCGQTAG